MFCIFYLVQNTILIKTTAYLAFMWSGPLFMHRALTDLAVGLKQNTNDIL